jgi:predicted phage terminase large subunit-like protein
VAALLDGLGPAELEALRYDWEGTWARPAQLVPRDGDWRTWLYLAGRGSGKTRAAAEWVRRVAREDPGSRIALIARTAADVRDVCVEGDSGILAVCPPAERPLYEPSKRRLTWRNGSQAAAYSADEPDLLRGPQHAYVWADELATWARVDETWSNLQLGLRLGAHPRCVVTTTPRPIPIIRDLLKNPTTIVRRGSTFDNAANLAPSALAEFRARFEGTRLGRQELEGEVLEDIEGSLFPRDLLDWTRVKAPPSPDEIVRVVVAVDPSVTATGGADECGIAVVAKARDGQLFVLADLSGHMTPKAWAERVARAYRDHRADRVIAEGNQGHALVDEVLRAVDPNLPVRRVNATRGKAARAEPVAALFEQGRAHIVGAMPQLEDQLVAFTVEGYGGSGSPDRADAAIWGCTAMASGMTQSGLFESYRRRALGTPRPEAEERQPKPTGGQMVRLRLPPSARTCQVFQFGQGGTVPVVGGVVEVPADQVDVGVLRTQGFEVVG